jgi:ElaB/YqjD/DUF883 family membrane-anchored ribosome-binding protein
MDLEKTLSNVTESSKKVIKNIKDSIEQVLDSVNNESKDQEPPKQQ